MNVSLLFTFRDLYNEWTVELKAMADRIISMRQQLFDALRARGKVVNILSFNSCIGLKIAMDIRRSSKIWFLLSSFGCRDPHSSCFYVQ